MEIEEFSTNELPVRIWPKKVDIQLLPLEITFHNVKVIPKKQLKANLSTFEIKNVNTSLSLWSLLLGNPTISHVTFNDASIKGVIDDQLITKNSKQSAKKQPAIDFKILKKIPIQKIKLNNFDLLFKISEKNLGTRIDGFNFEVENLEDKVRLHLSSKGFHIKKLGDKPILSLYASTNIVVSPKDIVVTAFKLKKKSSFLVGTGLLQGDILKGKFNHLETKMKTDLVLNEIYEVTQELFPEINFPKSKGSMQTELNLFYNFNKDLYTNFQIKTQGVFIEGYELGNTNINGSVKNQRLYVSQGTIHQSSGSLSVSDFALNLGEVKNFQGNVNVRNVEIGRMLNSIKVKNVPLYAPIQGDLPCYGQFTPKFNMTCNGTAKIKALGVWDGMDKKFNIVTLKEAQVLGGFVLDANKISFDTQLKINDSTGWSKGSVEFAKGFNINYGGTLKSIEQDVPNLANLKIEGLANITGKTWGNSSWGRIQLKLNGQKMWLEDFGLGNPKFDLSYKKGVLNFRNVSTRQSSTRAKGSLSLNLKSNLIRLDMTAPFLDAQDLTYLLSRKTQLPFSIKGSGSAKVRAKGPLQFQYLSYTLKSSIYRGSIAKESFDQLTFDLESKNGFVESKNIVVSKADSRIQFKGKVNPKGILDSVVLGERLRLEQSEFLNDIGFNLGGQLDFTMAMRGPILSPNTELHGRLSKMIIADAPEPDSSFWLKFNNNSIEGRGRFIGNIVNTEFKIPYSPDENFKLYLNTKNWNFANLFNMLSGSEIQKDYKTQLTTEIKLESPKNWAWNSSGYIRIPQVRLSKGDTYLENLKTMQVNFDKGVINTQDFRLDGPSSFIEVKAKDSRREKIDIGLSGKYDLSLLTLLTPFLDDLRGVSSVTLNLKGPAEKPDILGSAYVQNGFLKLKGLTHSFDNFTTDLLFNQNTLMVNALKSNFANGLITADGQIKFLSFDTIPIDIKGQFTNVNLNIPEGFETKGNGTLQIKGSKPPYILSAKYNINDGNINANLVNSSVDSQRIQPSDFLPKFLAEETLDPLHLNLDIKIKEPIEVNAKVPEAIVTTKVDGYIKVKNSPLKPILDGVIRSQPGGRMTFRSNNFDLASATIEYINSPPEEPNLLVSAKANIKAKPQNGEDINSGEDYEVTLDVEGNAKNPNISLSSLPILTETDIVSLLAFGVTSSHYQELDSDAQALQSGMEVGAQVLKQQLGITKAFENTTGFNLNISSVLDDETAALKYSASKQFSPKFGMSLGRTEGKTPTIEMKFEYKFNPKLSTIIELEKQEASATEEIESSSKSQEKIGLDLEYKFQYK